MRKKAHEGHSVLKCTEQISQWRPNGLHVAWPECVSPVIAVFLFRWVHDLQPHEREMVGGVLPAVIGTADPKLESARVEDCVNWMVNTQLPTWAKGSVLTTYGGTIARYDWRSSDDLGTLHACLRATDSAQKKPRLWAIKAIQRSGFSAARIASGCEPLKMRHASDVADLAYRVAIGAASTRSVVGVSGLEHIVKSTQRSALALIAQMIERKK